MSEKKEVGNGDAGFRHLENIKVFLESYAIQVSTVSGTAFGYLSQRTGFIVAHTNRNLLDSYSRKSGDG